MTSARPTIKLTGLLVLASALLLAMFSPAHAAARHPVHATRCVHKHGQRGKRCNAKARHRRRHVKPASARAGGSKSVAQAPPSSAPAGSRTACADATLIPDPSNLDRIDAAVLCMVNEQRAKNGLGALVGNRALGQVAASHDRSMVAQNYFDHVGPDGQDPLARIVSVGYIPAGFGYGVGENLGWGTGALAAPIYIVANWMNSPEHRANILDAGFKDTGISVIASVPALAGPGPGATYTQDFGDLVAPKVSIPLLP